jgi:tRNA threonylcarbamoyladenosine biosynthesis protein TsaE
MAEFILNSLDDTALVAKELASEAKIGDIFLLYGDLGAGKTTFSRLFIREFLKVPDLDVTSPTFNIIQTYGDPSKEVWHVDLYRIENSNEIYNLGLEDAYGNVLMLIEWSERFGSNIPVGNIIKLDFSIKNEKYHLNILKNTKSS